MVDAKIIRGAIIGAVANAAANYATFQSLQPLNIVLGLLAGAALGFVLK